MRPARLTTTRGAGRNRRNLEQRVTVVDSETTPSGTSNEQFQVVVLVMGTLCDRINDHATALCDCVGNASILDRAFLPRDLKCNFRSQDSCTHWSTAMASCLDCARADRWAMVDH